MTGTSDGHGRLHGKVALVTGAARGIGAAIARAFSTEGAFVFVTDLAMGEGTALAQHLGSRSAEFQLLDVRDEDRWQWSIDRVVALKGRLDVLVNNAGITGLGDVSGVQDPEHAALADWRSVHETNLDGVFLGCKYAIKAMRRTGAGSIINMSSHAGMVGVPFAAAYASSKAAVRNHTKSVALYCARQGLRIRCNSVHPGAVLTPMWEPILGDGPDRPARLMEAIADTPLGRFGEPEEVAAVCTFLASDEAAYITGTEIMIDGGLLAGPTSS